MFILFISFVFLSSVSVKCHSQLGIKPVVKTQVAKPLSRVNVLLSEMAGKIQRERKLLSQISNNLKDYGDSGFMDYQVTDIWWRTTSPHGRNRTRDTSTISETSTTTSTTTETTTAETTTLVLTTPKETPFIKQMFYEMEIDKYGVFTAFLVKLSEIFSRRDTHEIIPLINAVKDIILRSASSFPPKNTTDAMQIIFLSILNDIKKNPSFAVKEEYEVLYHILKNRHKQASREVNFLFDRLDEFYAESEVSVYILFRALEDFDNFPEGGKDAVTVAQEMINAILEPYSRKVQDANHNTIMLYLNKIYTDKTDFFSTAELYERNAYNDRQATIVTATVTARRRYRPNRLRHYEPYQGPHQKYKVRYLSPIAISKNHKGEVLRYDNETFSVYKLIHENTNLRKFYSSRRIKSINNVVTTERNKKYRTVSSKLLAQKNYLAKILIRQSPVGKKYVQRIREVSSYSDEEDSLRRNLYDAFIYHKALPYRLPQKS